MAPDELAEQGAGPAGGRQLGAPAWVLPGDDEGPPPSAWRALAPEGRSEREESRPKDRQYPFVQARRVKRLAHIMKQRGSQQLWMLLALVEKVSQNPGGVRAVGSGQTPIELQQGRRQVLAGELDLTVVGPRPQALEELADSIGDGHGLGEQQPHHE